MATASPQDLERELIRVAGELESMLGDLADAYDREVNTAVSRATAVLEPLMIVIMAVAVGFIVFSIMQPIIQMNEMAGV